MHRYRMLLLGLASVVLTGCSTVGPRSCLAGQQAAVQELIHFGAETPTGRVTPEEWTRFLAEVVTPKFPKGFTTWQASGQWLSASGEIVREPSYVLSVVHPEGSDEPAIVEVVDTYRDRFQQEAVLRVRTKVCMGL